MLRILALISLALQTSAATFPNGPSTNAADFPIAVWLQNPKNAERFREAGINTFVGLWRGPTEEQLAQLKAAGIKVICAQNSVGLAHINDPQIIAWMQNDEPDNAQSLGEGKGYGPPILPEKVIARYQEIRSRDASRPVLLNLGQGVAWDNYIGRGVRRNHPEDYAEYVKGGDIVSFDIYPATHDHADIKGKLEYVAKGVERLKTWAGPDRIVWNCIEAKLGPGETRVAPRQLRAEVWMSLIHGSRGIIYFVHQFKPVFREASLFEDPDLLKAVTEVNREIKELAPVLNSPTLENALTVTTKPEGGPVAAIAKRHGADTYIFAVAMSGQKSWATFRLKDISRNHTVHVLNEGRRHHNTNAFPEEFNAYQVHLYKVSSNPL